MSATDLILKNKDLASFSSWRVGGSAEYFCQPKSLEELKQVVAWAQENNHELTVLGSGTNVLIHDEGVKGLVIQMDHINHCLLYTSPSPRDQRGSRMPSSA